MGLLRLAYAASNNPRPVPAPLARSILRGGAAGQLLPYAMTETEGSNLMRSGIMNRVGSFHWLVLWGGRRAARAGGGLIAVEGWRSNATSWHICSVNVPANTHSMPDTGDGRGLTT
ncbi:MAG TPA: hypothetical protein VJL10_08935 [Anaerolineales bacterium]|nr:hypothetical protein [Anaerolineales bacterium]